MIKDYVARAMQISMLENDQLERVHILETARKYPLANWNIQSLFGLPEIKYRYEIPDDPEKQTSHHRRIEDEINRLDLLKTGVFYEDPIERLHVQDWNIFNAKNQIVWEYAGAKRSNLKDMLRVAVGFILVSTIGR